MPTCTRQTTHINQISNPSLSSLSAEAPINSLLRLCSARLFFRHNHRWRSHGWQMRNYYRVSLLSSLSCDWQICGSKQSCADRTKKMGGHIENTRGRKPTGNRSEKLLLYWYHIYHFYTHFFVCPIRCVWNAKRLVSIKLIDGMINANGFELINILWNAYMSQTVAAVEITCTRCVDLAIFKSSQISLWSRGKNFVCSIWNGIGNWDLYASSFWKALLMLEYPLPTSNS